MSLGIRLFVYGFMVISRLSQQKEQWSPINKRIFTMVR